MNTTHKAAAKDYLLDYKLRVTLILVTNLGSLRTRCLLLFPCFNQLLCYCRSVQ